MRNAKYPRHAARFLVSAALTLALTTELWAQTTIDPVVISIGATRDPVPGRDAPFVFRGESDVELPVINAAVPGTVHRQSRSLGEPIDEVAAELGPFEESVRVGPLDEEVVDPSGHAALGSLSI